ncbi:MAG: hypothetical protein JSU65_01600, partial [Candidatus Zixiibacteriota bacterium]
MKLSPLKFARSFEQLKLQLRAQPAGDLRLLVLVDFWPNLAEFLEDSTFRSYVEEYAQLLLNLVVPANLQDLLPLELNKLLEITGALGLAETDRNRREQISERGELAANEAARKFFYVGAVESGIETLAWVSRLEPPTIALDDSVEPLSEVNALKTVRQQFTESQSQLKPAVDRILSELEVEREALSFEEANCLFVEKNGHGDGPRGRLRRLQGSVEYRRKGAKTDEVTFENQIKAPNDPIVGVVYDALAAVGALCRESGISSP